MMCFQEEWQSNRVLSPDQAAEVQTPGIHGDAALGDTAHHQHEAVAGSVAPGLVGGEQRGGVVVAGAGGRAFLH